MEKYKKLVREHKIVTLIVIPIAWILFVTSIWIKSPELAATSMLIFVPYFIYSGINGVDKDIAKREADQEDSSKRHEQFMKEIEAREQQFKVQNKT